MTQIPTPVPLYPLSEELLKLNLADYPDLASFLDSGDAWWRNHWSWGLDFLSYVGRNKSGHTFLRFRNETERFLLWGTGKKRSLYHVKQFVEHCAKGWPKSPLLARWLLLV